MRTFNYRLVNVFAESIFGGNPLCVFEDARGLSDTEMQALALQFNLSETTFLLPSERAVARVRIFTPTFEMPFAGHPTLGSAHVARELRAAGDAVELEMLVGLVPVVAAGDRWTLKAAPACTRPCEHEREAQAALLGLATDDVLPGACWVDTGSEQLIVPLTSADAVRRAQPRADWLKQVVSSGARSMVYVFAANGEDRLLSRFFFLKHGNVVEDPGTGSATANLGGWMHLQGRTPCRFDIDQGEAVGRPCRLGLRVEANGTVYVAGRVVEIGRGSISLP